MLLLARWEGRPREAAWCWLQSHYSTVKAELQSVLDPSGLSTHIFGWGNTASACGPFQDGTTCV